MIFFPAHFTFGMKLISWVGFVARHIIAISTGLATANYLLELGWHPGWGIITGLAVWYMLDNLLAALVGVIFLLYVERLRDKENA